MVRKHTPQRTDVTQAITQALRPLDFVHALWEAGAASWGRIDRWSDIDLNADADDPRVHEVFPAVERALVALSPIELKVSIPFPAEHNYQQAFYRLRGASPYLIVDLAVFKHSAEDKYLDPAVHGPPVFLFDKSKVGVARPIDGPAFLNRIQARRERLSLRHRMFGCFVQKEIQRGNDIEAIDNYRRVILDTLLEVLRMRYAPLHYDFGSRYVHYELPPAVMRRFTRLSYVRDPEDLQRKNRAAGRWLRAELARTDKRELRARLEAGSAGRAAR